jgi:hypothetical protein
MRGKQKKNTDPLLQLFEHYLMNRSYEDVEAFTKQLALDYLAYLHSTPAQVPVYLRKNVLEDLEAEAHELLVKKMYGCVEATEYQNVGKVVAISEESEISAFDLPSFPEEEKVK